MVRIYDIPDNTFESSDEDEDEEEEEEEDEKGELFRLHREFLSVISVTKGVVLFPSGRKSVMPMSYKVCNAYWIQGANAVSDVLLMS